jgi:hypothetical protein
MYIKPILKGLLTYIPGMYKPSSEGTGGTVSARYCYAVWLRHLVWAHLNGLSNCPEVIAELGPGDSLGVGLAALLSGVDRYYAFDIVNYGNNQRNMEILDELVELFKQGQRIPEEKEFPKLRPSLESYEFPNQILTREHLKAALSPERIDSIRKALLKVDVGDKGSIRISYVVPWYEKSLKSESVDMIFSQAVLEHIDDLEDTCRNLYRWLKPSGFMSHQIDFKCHKLSPEWNGHWAYSDFVWKLIVGKRPYLLNRQPFSTHIHLLRTLGFEVVCAVTYRDHSGIQRKDLSPRFKYLSDEDLTISGAFIQAVKR